MLPQTSHAPAARAVGRRTLVLGTAWSAPAIVVASAAPAFAASPLTTFVSCAAAGYTVLAFEASPTSSINPTFRTPATVYSAAIPSTRTSVCYEVLAAGGGGGFLTTQGTTGEGGDGAFSVGVIDGTASKTLGLIFGNGGGGAQKGVNSVVSGQGYGQGGRASGIDANEWRSGGGGGGSAVLAGTTLSSTPLVVSGGGGGAGTTRLTSTTGTFTGGGGGDAGAVAQNGTNVVVTGIGTFPSYTLFAGAGAIGNTPGTYGRDPANPTNGTAPALATVYFGGAGGALHSSSGGGGLGGTGGTGNSPAGGGGGGYAGGGGGTSLTWNSNLLAAIGSGGGAGSSARAGDGVAALVTGYTVTGTVSTGTNHGVATNGASPTADVAGKGGSGYVKIYYLP